MTLSAPVAWRLKGVGWWESHMIPHTESHTSVTPTAWWQRGPRTALPGQTAAPFLWGGPEASRLWGSLTASLFPFSCVLRQGTPILRSLSYVLLCSTKKYLMTI